MGIRVNKVLGYGLTDVKVEDGRIADGRINAESPFLDDGDADVSLTAYLEYLRANDAGRQWWESTGQNMAFDNPVDCVTYQSEFGLDNVLVVRPVGTKAWGWSRHDDTIDYMEESFVHDQQNRIQVFERRGLYPFEGFMNAETGERLRHDIYMWVRAVNDNDERAEMLGSFDALAQLSGFTDHAEALRLVVPMVPEEVRTLVDFGRLFTNDRVWQQLRPLIYTYWG